MQQALKNRAHNGEESRYLIGDGVLLAFDTNLHSRERARSRADR